MHGYLVDWIVCPLCHGRLQWSYGEVANGVITTAEARCDSCAARYPVLEGIALLLDPQLPRQDLWEEVGSRLGEAVRADPELERQLMRSPLDTLTPADQFLRGLLLDEEGRHELASSVMGQAVRCLYTPEYLACADEMVARVGDRLLAAGDPVVDLASGRGRLLERLARRVAAPLVATDFSPRVLRGNLKRWKWQGIQDRVSLLALDARQVPFRDGAVKRMVSYLGLLNVQDPGRVLRELRRVVSGELLAVMHFFPEDDAANGQAIVQAGLEMLMYRQTALDSFAGAGFEVDIAHVCRGRAAPTPESSLMEGMRSDAIPVAETTLDWCLLVAR